MMRKTLTAMAAAGALAAATVTVPTQAEAHAWWWIPAAVVGGVVVGGAIAGSTARAYATPPGYTARGSVYVQPTRSRCQMVQEPYGFFGYRWVEVCR